MSIIRLMMTCITTATIALTCTMPGLAATMSHTAIQPDRAVTPQAGDVASARAATASNTQRVHLNGTLLGGRAQDYNRTRLRFRNAAQKSAASAPAVIYPDDLFYNGGPVMPSAELHNIYVNCTQDCFGLPGDFLQRLNASSWIHVLDQYVGATANNRYPYAGKILATVPVYTHTLYENDILAIVHASAAAAGNKPYKSVFNVFLPKGVDTCFDGSTSCYSPDNPSTFAFCGYHGSVTFSDLGHVIYSVLPFADVPQCTLLNSSPNGLLADTTDSVLSHETFELLTDPDLDAWYTFPFGSEIGDNCAYLYGFEHLAGRTYEVQTEYSNIVHGCVADYIP